MNGAPSRDFDPTNRWVLCLGSEQKGLRAKTRSAIDEFVAIPMAEGVESLNVAVTVGVVLFEAIRRRRAAEMTHPAPDPHEPGGP